MNEPDFPYYVMDKDALDDSEKWVVLEGTCNATGVDFTLVYRSDQEPICPICHPNHPRITRVSEGEYDDFGLPLAQATPSGPLKA